MLVVGSEKFHFTWGEKEKKKKKIIYIYVCLSFFVMWCHSRLDVDFSSARPERFLSSQGCTTESEIVRPRKAKHSLSYNSTLT